MKKSVLLGMSGGVDSSVAALLLQKQGYRVIGAFLKLYSETKNPLTGNCSYLDDVRDARKIAAKLNIPLIILDYEKEYKKQVLAPMFKSYQAGKTPNPDLACNSIIKFPFLWKAAKKHTCQYIATGHYARIKRSKRGYHLLAGKDTSKDQSYFLSELSQSDLAHTLFPLGNLTKTEVRKIAKKHKLHNWNKHGTVGICFVGQQPMQQFLKQKIQQKKGPVLDSAGKQIGEHSGLAFYTIGQKAGPHVGISITKPKQYAQSKYYIAEKRKPNTIIVAPGGHSSLYRKEISLNSLHLINPKEGLPSNLKARIRHLGQLHQGKLIKKKANYHFTFYKPLQGLAEGQYVVLYDKDRVVGTGEIRIKQVQG